MIAFVFKNDENIKDIINYLVSKNICYLDAAINDFNYLSAIAEALHKKNLPVNYRNIQDVFKNGNDWTMHDDIIKCKNKNMCELSEYENVMGLFDYDPIVFGVFEDDRLRFEAFLENYNIPYFKVSNGHILFKLYELSVKANCNPQEYKKKQVRILINNIKIEYLNYMKLIDYADYLVDFISTP